MYSILKLMNINHKKHMQIKNSQGVENILTCQQEKDYNWTKKYFLTHRKQKRAIQNSGFSSIYLVYKSGGIKINT